MYVNGFCFDFFCSVLLQHIDSDRYTLLSLLIFVSWRLRINDLHGMKNISACNILVVDDDNDVLYTAKLVLKGLFSKVDTLSRPGFIPDCLRDCKYDLILLDMNYSRGSTSGKEGLEWLERILQIDPEARVITTTAYGEIDLAVQAMKLGAIDFIVKPWNKDQLLASVRNVTAKDRIKKAENRNKNHTADSVNTMRSRYPEMLCRSVCMLQVLEIIKTVAPTDANVMIMGENGTGKELVAWSLHCESIRQHNSFVHVDLGAIPETLFEAELFGHTRGAFTDAKEERTGRFEAASGGTLFLDEIGNLSLPMQAKMLTAVQKREIIKIGTNYPIPVDVRLISATNMPLYQMAESFEFRQDLLYRLNTVEIMLPPLRERKEDIGLITDYYIKLFSEQYGKQGIIISEETRSKLRQYHWPGNIRELAHTIERAVIMNKSGTLHPEDFVLKIKSQPAMVYDEPILRVEDFERKAITNALNKNNGNLSRAADDLGVARTTLYRKISHFGIETWR
jgi:two-component system, NtrC family, response regulator HydG